VILILFFPREVLSAAREGLLLWFNSVLPALLPFIVAVNLLTALGFVKLISTCAQPFMMAAFKLPGAGGFALITGLITGYPMGAKTVADLWHSGEITTKEAQRLLAFCNNAGPLFIVGVVGVGLLGDTMAGYVLWAGHIAAALIIGVLTRRWEQGRSTHMHGIDRPYIQGSDNLSITETHAMCHKKDSPSIGKVLGESVKNAMEALLVVGGLIIFFSVVVQAITIIIGDLPYIAQGMLAGIMEITGGVKILAEAPSETISSMRIAVIGGVIAFGGFSVHAQALHFTSSIGIKASKYILFKAFSGIVAAGATWVIWRFFMYN